ARVQLTYEDTPGLAAKRFRAMLDENPKLDAARYGLAIAEGKSGQHDKARENLQILLAKAPNDVVYNLAQIESDMATNRLAAAEKRLEHLTGLYPGNYPVRQARIDL